MTEIERAHILLVDDEKPLIKALAAILTSRGYDVQTAFSGSEALHIYKRENFDLLITDLKMPVMDGIELIRQVRVINPAQRIIVATGFPGQLTPWNKRFSEAREDAFDMGTLDYLVKPFSGKKMLKLVEKVLNEAKAPKKTEPAPDKNRSVLASRIGPSGLTCADLVLMYALGGKSTILGIRKDHKVGYIYLEKGEVVHAQTVAHQGEEAFFEILSWETSDVKTKPYEEGPHTIKRNLDALLLVVMSRLQDKQGKGKEIQKENHRKPSNKEDTVPELNTLLEAIGADVEAVQSAVAVTQEGAVAANVGIDAPDQVGAITAFLSGAGKQIGSTLGIGPPQTGLIAFKKQKLLTVDYDEYTLGFMVSTRASITATAAAVARILES